MCKPRGREEQSHSTHPPPSHRCTYSRPCILRVLVAGQHFKGFIWQGSSAKSEEPWEHTARDPQLQEEPVPNLLGQRSSSWLRRCASVRRLECSPRARSHLEAWLAGPHSSCLLQEPSFPKKVPALPNVQPGTCQSRAEPCCKQSCRVIAGREDEFISASGARLQAWQLLATAAVCPSQGVYLLQEEQSHPEVLLHRRRREKYLRQLSGLAFSSGNLPRQCLSL